LLPSHPRLTQKKLRWLALGWPPDAEHPAASPGPTSVEEMGNVSLF